MTISIESEFDLTRFRQLRHAVFDKFNQFAGRIQDANGRPSCLAVRASKKSAKKRKVTLRCQCQHAKSIHSRMYANQKLGTACNFPSCRCKGYKAK